MSEERTFTTKTGKTFTETELLAMADGLDTETGFDVDKIRPTRRRTPKLGDTVTKPSSYRIPDRQKQAIKKRAKADHKTESEVVRAALDAYLTDNTLTSA